MQIVLLYFGQDVRTRLGVAIYEVSGPPVFHIKMNAPHQLSCSRTQHPNFLACSSQPSLNVERQAEKLRIPFLKVFWYDSIRGITPGLPTTKRML